MPENLTVPMPGKGRDEEAGAGLTGSPSAAALQAQADAARQKAGELFRALPAEAKSWPAEARSQLGKQLGDLAGDLRLLGCGQTIWKPVMELATSFRRLTPDGAFPPLPRGVQLERLKKVLGSLAADDGPLAGSTADCTPPSQGAREKPDLTYTRMLLKKLGSD